jgi:hypothetical protein
MRYIITFLCGFIAITSVQARSLDHENPVITDAPNCQLRVHRASNIAFSITNYGKIGSEMRDLYDPYLNIPAPSAEFPKDSGIEHLFSGCLWIGAVVEGDEPGVLDTLVSIGDDGWWSGINELNPPSEEYPSLWYENLMADEEYFAIYYDTTIIGVTPDPNDNRPHRPLGLKVTQHSMCWSTPGYDEFFVIDYHIENISDRVLNDIWLGIYYEGDVMHISEGGYSPEAGAQDDLCGFIERGDGGIAWIADNDGQPYDGVFNYRSSTGLMGFMLLGSSTPSLQTNFNWWISHVNSPLDFGPQWQSNFDIWHEFPGGGRGTPGGDRAKYQVMSNGERDYDQVWSNLDCWEDQGWIPNNANSPTDLANGFDTRYLISWGAFDLEPGEIETVTVAYIGGNDLHQDPDNYADNLRDHTDDSLSIVEYYNNLDFSDLVEKADSVSSLYQNGYEMIPIGPPHNLAVADWGTDFVELTWNSIQRDNFAEYRLYRGTAPGAYDPIPITPSGFTDTTFVDTNVQDNTYYYYAIASVNTYQRQGKLSSEVHINTGQPLPPAGLTTERGNHLIWLDWNDNPEYDISGYIIYRTINNHLNVYEIIDTCQTSHYLDDDLANGFRYYYKLKALDIHNITSFYSDTVSAIPMELNQGILLVNANSNNPTYNPDYDSMAVFYEELLENSGYQYTITNSGPDTISDLTSYEIVVWCKEHVPAPGMNFINPDNTDLFSSYLDGGGKLILAGSRLAAPTFSYWGTYYFSSFDFQYVYLNLEGVEHPNLNNTEFIGGQTTAAFFPRFDVDTVRANRIVWPNSDNDGRLFGVGTLIPASFSANIYAYEAVNPDTSNFHNRPIAIIHRTENYSVAVLEFPLYYVEEPTSFEIFNKILQVFESVDIKEEPIAALPEKTTLLQNYPNPFNSSTTISYELSQTGGVMIDIFDILGRKVESLINQVQPAGKYSLVWEASALPSGVYFARLQIGDLRQARKMLLLK